MSVSTDGGCLKDKPTLFLICAALPVIAVFGFSSLRKAAGPNWPAFAYFAFSILIAKFCLDGTSVLRKRLWAVAVSSSLLLSAVATLHASFNLLPLARYSPELAAADVANSFHGWRELAQELERNHAAPRPCAPTTLRRATKSPQQLLRGIEGANQLGARQGGWPNASPFDAVQRTRRGLRARCDPCKPLRRKSSWVTGWATLPSPYRPTKL